MKTAPVDPVVHQAMEYVSRLIRDNPYAEIGCRFVVHGGEVRRVVMEQSVSVKPGEDSGVHLGGLEG